MTDGRTRNETYVATGPIPSHKPGSCKVTARFKVWLDDERQLDVVRVRYGAETVVYYERGLFERMHRREDVER